MAEYHYNIKLTQTEVEFILKAGEALLSRDTSEVLETQGQTKGDVQELYKELATLIELKDKLSASSKVKVYDIKP
jgi:hypothetical protein|tara:strand:+ start:187 stop:411 length:225 start_codon:yes stop_codon:yes gene_type:complete